MAVTKIEEIKKQAAPKELDLPAWEEGEVFTARLKRPSILGLASKGHIPNSLLSAAQKMFTNQVDEKIDFKQISSVMKAVAGAALVEPTIEELDEAEIELTDDQLAAIFSYVQGGLRELEKFRTKQADNQDNQSGGTV